MSRGLPLCTVHSIQTPMLSRKQQQRCIIIVDSLRHNKFNAYPRLIETFSVNKRTSVCVCWCWCSVLFCYMCTYLLALGDLRAIIGVLTPQMQTTPPTNTFYTLSYLRQINCGLRGSQIHSKQCSAGVCGRNCHYSLAEPILYYTAPLLVVVNVVVVQWSGRKSRASQNDIIIKVSHGCWWEKWIDLFVSITEVQKKRRRKH